MKTIKTVCKFGACEPQCGLVFDVNNDKITKVRPDPEHPISRGYACKKGMAIPEYVHDPDRLLTPEKQSLKGFEQVSWQQATNEIGKKLRQIRKKYGPNSIATYWGNAADSSTMIVANTLCSALGSPNSMNVLSLEYTDRGAVAERMFGEQTLILQPDADQADFALLLGTNPLVTQGMTLLQRRPRIAGDLKALRQRGGKLVVVDPRETETSRVADQHIMIKPGGDLYLLLAMLKLIIENKCLNHAYVKQHTKGIEWWNLFTASLDLTHLSELCGIEQSVIETLALEFSQAKKAFITTRVGVQTSRHSALTEWLVQVLNTVTGRVAKNGGVFFNSGAINNTDLIHLFTKKKNPANSRIGDYPQIFGGPPASVFADDVLSDSPDRIRALIVFAGNPLLSFPNAKKVEQALGKLDLLVTVDLYRSETGALAHYNLPACSIYEKGGFHFLTQPFDPYPHLEWRKKIISPRGEARAEWDIARDIFRAASLPFLNNHGVSIIDKALSIFGSSFTESHFAQLLLLSPFSKKKYNLSSLKNANHGVKVGEVDHSEFYASQIQTSDKRIHLAPEDFSTALEQLLTSHDKNKDMAESTQFPMRLISGARHLSSFNTWSKNLPSLQKSLKENCVTLNSRDANKLGIQSGDLTDVISETGRITLRAQCSDTIREGVLVIPQFWGHRFASSQKHTKAKQGVNVNILHSDSDLCEFTGMPVFNGTFCRIEKSK